MSEPDLLESIPPSPIIATPSGSDSVERDQRIFKPASWFERLVPARMFGREAPYEVELGSGDGSFLLEWARRHPDRDFIGVERLLGRIRKLDRKSQRQAIPNVLGLRIEASYCVQYLLPPSSVSAIHLYFPDPWPKRRHHKNRLVNRPFAASVLAALNPGACIHLRTDNLEYFTQMRDVFGSTPGFTSVATPDDLAAVLTDFERGFLADGIPTQRASYRRE